LLERIRQFSAHHLVRKTAILQVGSISGTVVQAIAGIFLARLLGPDSYGRFALAFSIAAVCSVFIGGSLTDAIAPSLSRAWASRDRKSYLATVGFYLRFVAVCAAVTLVVIAILPWVTGHLYHDTGLGWLASVIIIASIISVSVFALVQLSLQVAGRFTWLSSLTFTDVFVRYGASVASVLAGFGVAGAVSGHLIGAAVMLVLAATLYARIERKEPFLPAFRTFVRLARDAVWQPLLKPTLLVLADSNFALLYGALPIAMVGLYVRGAELAYFKLAFGYLMLAMTAMGPVSTVMNVHFPTIQTTDPVKLRRTFVRITQAAVALSTGITAVVLAISPLVFRVLYGRVYLPAIPYVYGFAVFGALFGLGVGLGPMWRALNKVRTSIIINSITLGLGIPLGLALIHVWHLWGAVIMVTLWYSASHAVSFWYLTRWLKLHPERATI
ncbi:MAG TPA: oligosaccharide flippase family protein, partial [Candidatus Paceibacterota bacterium]|nr:oligosaccharide flippase family protein [Candidatus Paceibacterota bacterium]